MSSTDNTIRRRARIEYNDFLSRQITGAVKYQSQFTYITAADHIQLVQDLSLLTLDELNIIKNNANSQIPLPPVTPATIVAARELNTARELVTVVSERSARLRTTYDSNIRSYTSLPPSTPPIDSATSLNTLLNSTIPYASSIGEVVQSQSALLVALARTLAFSDNLATTNSVFNQIIASGVAATSAANSANDLISQVNTLGVSTVTSSISNLPNTTSLISSINSLILSLTQNFTNVSTAFNSSISILNNSLKELVVKYSEVGASQAAAAAAAAAAAESAETYEDFSAAQTAASIAAANSLTAYNQITTIMSLLTTVSQAEIDSQAAALSSSSAAAASLASISSAIPEAPVILSITFG
jgi:hypothetical protein